MHVWIMFLAGVILGPFVAAAIALVFKSFADDDWPAHFFFTTLLTMFLAVGGIAIINVLMSLRG